MRLATELHLPGSELFPVATKKDLVVLHHTAGGSAPSTVECWRRDPRRIGTAYIIERDGTIYEVFPPECSAYHLGLKGASVVDWRSIGIEIATEGALLERGGKLYAFDRVSERTWYTGAVYEHPVRWRGRRYFAAYTEAALVAVCELVAHLLGRFGIERQTPADHLYASRDLRTYRGVLSHSHLRSDKTDVHPGFGWERLVQQCGLRETMKVKAVAV